MSKVFETLGPKDQLEVDTSSLDDAPCEAGPPPGVEATTPADSDVAHYAIRQVAAFADLDDTHVERLVSDARVGLVPPGRVLYREGEPVRAFYVLLEGAAQLTRRWAGESLPVAHAARGEAAGLCDAVCGAGHLYSARTLTETMVLEVPQRALSNLLSSEPAIDRAVREHFRARLLKRFLHTPLFDGCGPESRAQLKGRFEERVLEPGDSLVKPGQVMSLALLPLSGTLLLDFRSRPGQSSFPEPLGPGLFVLVASALQGVPAQMHLYADARCTVMLADLRALLGPSMGPSRLTDWVCRLPPHAQALCPGTWAAPALDF